MQGSSGVDSAQDQTLRPAATRFLRSHTSAAVEVALMTTIEGGHMAPGSVAPD